MPGMVGMLGGGTERQFVAAGLDVMEKGHGFLGGRGTVLPPVIAVMSAMCHCRGRKHQCSHTEERGEEQPDVSR